MKNLAFSNRFSPSFWRFLSKHRRIRVVISIISTYQATCNVVACFFIALRCVFVFCDERTDILWPPIRPGPGGSKAGKPGPAPSSNFSQFSTEKKRRRPRHLKAINDWLTAVHRIYQEEINFFLQLLMLRKAE